MTAPRIIEAEFSSLPSAFRNREIEKRVERVDGNKEKGGKEALLGGKMMILRTREEKEELRNARVTKYGGIRESMRDNS